MAHQFILASNIYSKPGAQILIHIIDTVATNPDKLPWQIEFGAGIGQPPTIATRVC